MVKKILFFVVLATMAASCLKSSYDLSYYLDVNFDVAEGNYNDDSIHFEQILGMGHVYFLNSVNKETGEFGGCILSMAHNIHVEDCSPYSVYDTTANFQSHGFMLFYNNPAQMPEHHLFFDSAASGKCSPAGCYVHNTTETVGAVKEKFRSGDWLLLEATGYLDGSATKTASIYLADFRERKDSVVTKWTPFDLSGLGSIEYIDFQVTSSRDDVPLNFCMDDFCAQVAISTGNE